MSLRALALIALLAAGACLTVTAWADTATSLQVLQDCLAGPSTGTAASSAGTATRPAEPGDLAARCPGLVPAITDLGLSGQLQAHWQRHLSRNLVEGLLQLTQRYQAGPPGNAPSLALLPPASPVAPLLQPRRSWWQQLKDWLRDWLSQPGAGGSGWLRQLLSRISVPLLLQRLIVYLTTAAVLAMALWIIVHELQAAGVLTGRRRAGRARGPVLAPPAAPPRLGLTEVERAPAHERSVLLVRWLVQALLQSGRLMSERSLTYRELGERGAFDDPGQRSRFMRLARRAERDRYGERQPDGSSAANAALEQALAEGRALYAELASAPVGGHRVGGHR